MDTRTDAADASDGGGAEWAPPAQPAEPAPRYGAEWAPPAQPAPRSARALPTARNETARWARICAIVSVLFNPLLLVSVAAIVLGIVGLHRAEQPPFAGRFDSGRRQAMTGIGIGVFGLVWGVAVLGLFIAWILSSAP